MQWEEPDVAVPVPAYTGQPMEEPPEGTRKRRRRPEEVEEEDALERTERELASKLKTAETGKVRKDSDMRKSLRRSSRRTATQVDYREQPPSPLPASPPPHIDNVETKKPKLRRSRRSTAKQTHAILNSKLRLNGAVKSSPDLVSSATPPPTADMEKTPKQEEKLDGKEKEMGPKVKKEEEEPNNDYCSACGGFGDFVCCENCPRSFHLLCADPPLSEDELPDGAWYCNSCAYKMKIKQEEEKEAQGTLESRGSSSPTPASEQKLTIRIKTQQGHEKDRKEKKEKRRKDKEKKKTAKDKGSDAQTPVEESKKDGSIAAAKQAQKLGLFGEMLQQLEKRNPQVFRLPKTLQHRFDGVLVGENGEYINEYELPPKKPRDREENMRLERGDGEIILCFKCSRSALSGPIITCDKCKLPWHIDCLDPPQFNLPTRWVCPNHVENAAKIPRRLRVQKVKDTFLRRGHKNNGLIEVYDDDGDDQVTKFTPGLIGDVKETPNGFKAVMAQKQSDDAIYRIPAREIKLDFIDFVHARWNDPWRETQDSRLIQVLDELSAKPLEEREATRNLAYLKLQDRAVDAAIAKKNIDTLVQVALDDNDDQQALAIRKLLQLKGKKRLLEFLNSD